MISSYRNYKYEFREYGLRLVLGYCEIILCSILVFLIIFALLFFILGSSYMLRSNYEKYECEYPIYPYGCKLDENATHCFVVDCMKIRGEYNFAMCKEINVNITTLNRMQVWLYGIVVTGCPVYIEEIGINKYNGKENWKVNKK